MLSSCMRYSVLLRLRLAARNESRSPLYFCIYACTTLHLRGHRSFVAALTTTPLCPSFPATSLAQSGTLLREAARTRFTPESLQPPACTLRLRGVYVELATGVSIPATLTLEQPRSHYRQPTTASLPWSLLSSLRKPLLCVLRILGQRTSSADCLLLAVLARVQLLFAQTVLKM
jgi:hypothetical protein